MLFQGLASYFRQAGRFGTGFTHINLQLATMQREVKIMEKEYCENCNGFGSSLTEDNDVCSVCQGTGLADNEEWIQSHYELDESRRD